MLISVITPCFNEEENVAACRDAVRRVFEEQLPQSDYEHIFADNASTDGTLAALADLAAADARVKVIGNARNVGPFRNTFNALRSASGDAVVVLLAADLQDPPELIATFVQRWQEGYDVVYGVRAKRRESARMRLARRLYYRLVARLADVDIPVDTGEFQLVDRKIAERLKEVDDYYPYIRAMIAQCGGKAVGVPYEWRARRRGKSKNRLYHLLDQGMNGLISTSNLPMRLSVFAGFALSAASILYALIQLAWNLIFFGAAPSGIATLIIGLMFFSGVQLFFIGILGEYIAAIHAQVRRGPKVAETLRLNFETNADGDDGAASS